MKYLNGHWVGVKASQIKILVAWWLCTRGTGLLSIVVELLWLRCLRFPFPNRQFGSQAEVAPLTTSPIAAVLWFVIIHTQINKPTLTVACVCNYSYTFFFFFLHNVNQGVRRTSKPVCWKIFSFPSYGLTNSRFPNSTFFNPSHHKNPKYLIFKLLNLFSIQESLHLFTTTYKITMLDLTSRIVKDKMKIYLWSSKAFLP